MHKNLLLLCAAKTIRTIGFGAFSVILALYLLQRNFSAAEIGFLFSATLLEDALITTLAASFARLFGFRTILYISSALIVIGGIVLATAEAHWLIAAAVICGIVSPAGYEGGPFAPLEQTIIAQTVDTQKMTRAFSWYNLVGFAGAAIGALCAGVCIALMRTAPPLFAYQIIIGLYALSGVVLALLYSKLTIKETQTAECNKVAGHPEKRRQSSSDRDAVKRIIALAGLQGIDALGGGFVVQSLLTLWFYQRYHLDAAFLGPIYFFCNVIAALSFFVSPIVVKRLGLLNTMVFTHLPCSLALCFLPFIPTGEMAAALLLLRSAFSSMDIPVRQAYTMIIVPEDKRSFAAAVTSSARAIAQGLAPGAASFVCAGAFFAAPLVAGVLKSVYDIALFVSFRKVAVPDASALPMPSASQSKQVVLNAR